MPRLARVVIPDHPYHITQRGNGRQVVFQDDEDRLQYLSWINIYSLKYHLSLLAYCLMDNHVHFIAVPRKQDALAKKNQIQRVYCITLFFKIILIRDRSVD